MRTNTKIGLGFALVAAWAACASQDDLPTRDNALVPPLGSADNGSNAGGSSAAHAGSSGTAGEPTGGGQGGGSALGGGASGQGAAGGQGGAATCPPGTFRCASECAALDAPVCNPKTISFGDLIYSSVPPDQPFGYKSASKTPAVLDDLDGDGNVDWIAAYQDLIQSKCWLFALKGDPSGTFSSLLWTLPFEGEGVCASLLQVDIGGQSRVILVTQNNYGERDPQTHVLKRNGTGYVVEATIDHQGCDKAVDLTGDGVPELVCGGLDGLGHIATRQGDQWTVGDGFSIDIGVVFWAPLMDAGKHRALLLTGGNGSELLRFAGSAATPTLSPFPLVAYFGTADDVLGEGASQLIVGPDPDGTLLQILHVDPQLTGVMAPAVTIDTGILAGASSAVVRDLDDDGHRDLMVFGYPADKVYRQRADGSFVEVWHDNVGLGGNFPPAFVDVDHDGRVDLVSRSPIPWVMFNTTH